MRAGVALAAGPALGVTARLACGPAGAGLGADAAWAVGLAVWMAAWWINAAAPLAVTALLPLVVLPLAGVGGMAENARAYSSPVIGLFMGGFMLQAAVERWGLHRRVALGVLLLAGPSPRAQVGGVIASTALLSMWMSNAAAAALMMPIGASIVAAARGRAGPGPGAGPGAGGSGVDAAGPATPQAQARAANFQACVLLGVAFGASIGGMGTPVGTPPNALVIGQLREAHSVDVSFLAWALYAVPIMLALLGLTWAVLCLWLHPVGRSASGGGDGGDGGGRGQTRAAWRALGPLSAAQWGVVGCVGLAVVGWLAGPALAHAVGLTSPGPGGAPRPRITDEGVALTAAVLLFVIPARWPSPTGEPVPTRLLTWEQAQSIPWGVLVLFGGGLSLADAMDRTGVTAALGEQLGALRGAPPLVVLLVVGAAVSLVSNVMSNTALTAAMAPVVSAGAVGLGMEPAALLAPLALFASTCFVLPSGTPPNAVVFSSGHLRISQLARAGGVLAPLAVAVIALMTWLMPPGVASRAWPAPLGAPGAAPNAPGALPSAPRSGSIPAGPLRAGAGASDGVL
ncbi:MAG: hypothetical protein C0513_08070, partial [Isosphaera sp.]|nr:hypothetical protein [Isosphaera sp.]